MQFYHSTHIEYCWMENIYIHTRLGTTTFIDPCTNSWFIAGIYLTATTPLWKCVCVYAMHVFFGFINCIKISNRHQIFVDGGNIFVPLFHWHCVTLSVCQNSVAYYVFLFKSHFLIILRQPEPKVFFLIFPLLCFSLIFIFSIQVFSNLINVECQKSLLIFTYIYYSLYRIIPYMGGAYFHDFIWNTLAISNADYTSDETIGSLHIMFHINVYVRIQW